MHITFNGISLFKSNDPSGISNNSKDIKPGYIFVAIKGNKVNGEDFIPDAIQNGAKSIVLEGEEERLETKNDILYIYSKNPRSTQSYLASQIYPGQPKTITAITGTNGKTSTTNFARQLLNKSGKKSASIGTLGVLTDDNYSYQECMTTPDSILLHQELSYLSKKGITDLFLEASSHALSQSRLDYVNIENGAFLNFSQDHLDYHKDMDSYFSAKSDLIKLCKNAFIYNADDPQISQFMMNQKNIELLSFGFNGKDCKILRTEPYKNLQKIEIEYFGKHYFFLSNLIGRFQIYNLIASLMLSTLHGVKINEALENIESLKSAPGRMELVGFYTNAKIFIDFAHTPDGLKKTLLSLKDEKHSRIITVFGCGGDRDKNKRPLMGQIASRLSDAVIITNDNPRSEDPKKIIANICVGLQNYKIIQDRRTAIKEAISMLKDGDILLIAGKGHENFQIIGNEKIHFSDKECVLEEISKNVPRGTF